MQEVRLLKSLSVVVLILIITLESRSQTCGFGCLGLSGAYAGYTWQNYNAKGLNDYLQSIVTVKYDNAVIDLNRGEGFRLGANIFRAKFDDYFLSVKGFYQFLREKEAFSDSRQEGLVSDKIELIMNHWGVGVDFGIPVFQFLDFKIIEGGLMFINVEVKNESEVNGQRTKDVKFSNQKAEIGYFAGTGLILHIVKDYVSLEGTASYSFFNIDKLQGENGELIPGDNSSTALIKNSGVSMTVQINLGIPL